MMTRVHAADCMTFIARVTFQSKFSCVSVIAAKILSILLEFGSFRIWNETNLNSEKRNFKQKVRCH